MKNEMNLREQILNVIEKDARILTSDLADIVGVDEQTVAAEIEKMEDEQIICGYNTLVNWEKFGEEKANALIEVKVTPQRGVGFDQIAERIWQYPEVTSVFLISGSFDFAVFIEGKSMREVARFVTEKLSTIDGILSTATQFMLKSYKDKGFVIENPRRDERIELS